MEYEVDDWTYELEFLKEDSEELNDVKQTFPFLEEDKLVGRQTNKTVGAGEPRPIRIVLEADEREKSSAA